MAESVDRVDIAIIGAGPVGMTLALALAGGPYKVLLIDSRRRGAWAADPRALALSHGTRQILENISAPGTPRRPRRSRPFTSRSAAALAAHSSWPVTTTFPPWAT
jgi:2-polyprenyl-6-methoxyphenol hydroxylase-like FAD-dependent oxidoreductase